MHPPLREMRALRRVAGQPQVPEALAGGPAQRRPDLEVRVELGDPEGFEEEAGESEEEENPEEEPVADHVGLAVVLPLRTVGPPVVESERPQDTALHRHDPKADDQRDAEDVEEERVAEVEPALEEVPPEDRAREVVLERQDGRAGEEHHEPVEDEQVAEAGRGITLAEPGVRDDHLCDPLQAPLRLVDLEGAASPPVLERQLHGAPEEDRRRDDDQDVPEDDLPGVEVREGLARLGGGCQH